MNSKLFITFLCLSLLILGCSSSGGSNSTKPDEPDVGVPVNPIEGEAENPIEKDKGYALIDGVVYLDGDVLGTIETDIHGKKMVVDPDGNTIARISQSGQGYWIYIEHAGSGDYKDHYHIVQKDGNWTIDWANSVVDHGWGVDSDSIVKPEPMTDAQKKAAFKKRLQSVRDNIKAKKLKR